MTDSHGRDVTGLDSRAAALAVVEAALKSRSGLEEALNRPPFNRLEPRERAGVCFIHPGILACVSR